MMYLKVYLHNNHYESQILSGNFTMKDFLNFNWKDSFTHVHELVENINASF